MSLVKNKRSLTIWLLTIIGLLLCVTFVKYRIEKRLENRDAIENVAKGLELKDTANTIEWIVKEGVVDGKPVKRIEGMFENTLDVPIDGLKITLILYDDKDVEIGRQVSIIGTLFENSSRLLFFDLEEKHKNFDSFVVQMEYEGYTTENKIETQSTTREKNNE